MEYNNAAKITNALPEDNEENTFDREMASNGSETVNTMTPSKANTQEIHNCAFGDAPVEYDSKMGTKTVVN